MEKEITKEQKAYALTRLLERTKNRELEWERIGETYRATLSSASDKEKQASLKIGRKKGIDYLTVDGNTIHANTPETLPITELYYLLNIHTRKLEECAGLIAQIDNNSSN